MALEISFAADLVIFFNKSNLKLQGKPEPMCRTYIMVKPFQWQLVSESQVLVNWFIYSLCCQKLKQEAKFQFPHILVVNLFSKLKLHFQEYIFDLETSAKEISIFRSLFNCAMEA